MGHLKITGTRAEATPTEWLNKGAQIGEVVNEWAARHDLVVYVGPGAGGPAPACFTPALSEIEVNVDVAFGLGVEPQTIEDFRERMTQREWPKASGAIFHEALHARFTKWSLPAAHATLSKAEYDALELLEESRIESFGVKAIEKNREFLRSCALEIVLNDIEANMDKVTTIAAASRIAGLLLARIDAGVLDKSDAGEVPDMLDILLGVDLVDTLRDIWTRAHKHDIHHDATYLYELAREWVKAVEDAQKEKGEKTEAEQQQDIQDIIDALGEAADAIGFSVRDALDGEEQSEQWAKIASGLSQKAQEKADHERAAKKIFTEQVGPRPETKTISKLVEKRQPTSEERVAAVKVATMLDKAKYRERSEHVIKSVTPPGRLRSRALVQSTALKSRGVMQQAEAWKRTVRKHTDDPTLKIGVMVDISGSMGGAMQPMAVAAWVLSEAAKRADATTAMVYYGGDVFPTLKPGQHLDQVTVYSAKDHTEKFDKGFVALDGSLNLLHSDGARLLVIVSDGHYGDAMEMAAARKWLKRCKDDGVAVLWVTYDRDDHIKNYYSKDTDIVIVHATGNTSEVAEAIGNAAVKALGKIGQRAA